jgi:ATP-dependent helicase/nuclease subunit A
MSGATTSPEGPRLTELQARPLSVRGASVALSAGAGCGKTTVLTERFLHALRDAGALRSIVALTFTEKAARELRKRIRGECHRRLRAAGDAEETAFWRSTLRGLEAAPVNTFHEYCAGLLRRHALDAGVDPDFEILDAAIADTVRDEALARELRRGLAALDDDLIELGVEFGLRRVRHGIGMLVHGHDAAELDAWAGRSAEDLIGVWNTVWEAEGRAALFEPVERAARQCEAWLGAHEFDYQKLVAFRESLLEGLADLRPDLPAERLKLVRGSTLFPTSLRKQHWPEPTEEIKLACQKVVVALRAALDAYLKVCSPDDATTRHAADLGLRFVRLAAASRRAYDAAKRQRGGLDFDDLIHKVRDLVRTDTGAATVRGDGERGIAFVLVDEFQDTDPVQAEVLRRVAGDAFATGRLFIVGDFKQSIYRFRGAEPGLFQEFRRDFPDEGRHDLVENFRSSAGVIDFVNALFADAFPGESPRLLPGPHAMPASDGPAVEFLWADGSGDDESSETVRDTAEARRQAEAARLAKHLRARLLAGWPVRDRATKQVRLATAGDVAFLFRSLNDIAPYEQALAAQGLDYHVVGGRAYYTQQEVRDLVNVLSVVEDPCDVLALAGALRGPAFGLSDGALLWLHQAGAGDLADGLDASDEAPGLSTTDRDRAGRARGLLARWRALKDHAPIAELVDRVLDESGYEAALLGESLGGRKRANARKLVRLARRFDAQGGFTLADFVARLRADLDETPREEQAATTEEEGAVVRLMTIHQSKGLEFPIVVVPDLNRRSQGRLDAVAFDARLGPLVRPTRDESADDDASGKSLGWLNYEAIERREDDAEALRLFYVATTRARDALILSHGGAADASPISAAMRLLNGRFDRASGSCRAALAEGWTPPTVRVTTGESPPPDASPATRREWPDPALAAAAIRSARLATHADAEPGATTSPPRFVDLDSLRGLSPRADRLDGLVRAVLADPRLFAGRDHAAALPEILRSVARRQTPVASTALVEEALSVLASVVGVDLGARLASAATVERGVEWTASRPNPGGDPTVVTGRTEFFARDRDGTGLVVVVSAPGAAPAVERLRLLLSARVAAPLGFGPVAEAWHVSLGAGVQLVRTFDEPALAQAFREAGF